MFRKNSIPIPTNLANHLQKAFQNVDFLQKVTSQSGRVGLKSTGLPERSGHHGQAGEC